MAGSPVARAALNQSSAELWLDTGASFSVIGSDVAVGADIWPVPGVTARATIGASGEGHSVDVQLGIIGRLGVGALMGSDTPVVILPEEELRFRILFVTIVHVDGLLGWDVLGHLRVTVDYPAASLAFEPSSPSAAGDRNLFWYGLPIVVGLTLEGRRLLLGVDTGAARSYLTPRGAAKLGAAGARSVDDATFMFGGARVRASRLPVLKAKPNTPTGLDGMLANDLFSLGTLVVDGDAGVLRLAPDRPRGATVQRN